MLRALLAKDLRRVWRNPLPALINIALPLCLTALIGLMFGGRSSNELGRIRFAIVDEDRSTLSGFLRGGANQNQASEHLEPVFLDRQAALRQVNDNKLSAALVIPTNFTSDYFAGREVRLELIKNPAQSMQPAVLEELFGCVVAGLNAIARNFSSEFPAWRAAFDGDLDHRKIATLLERVGNKVESLKKFISPPLVSYEKVAMGADPKAKPASNLSNMFAWVLTGTSAMFLLFLANTVLVDLQREVRFRTFDRYRTLRERLLPFVAGKVLFAIVFLLICNAVMLGGGALVFRIHWTQPLALAALAAAYSCCAAAIMALFVALVPDERRAATLNSIVGIIFGIVGGCMFPVGALPRFLGDHVTPLLPTYWFVKATHELQEGKPDMAWGFIVLKLLVVSIVLIAVAVEVFQRRSKRGVRA